MILVILFCLLVKCYDFGFFALKNMNLRKWYRMDDSLSDYPLFKGAANQKFKPIKTCGWREI